MEDQLLQETLETTQDPNQDYVEQPLEQAQAASIEKPNDRNIRDLRKKAEQLESERNEYYRLLQEAKKQPQSQESTENMDDLSINPDDFVEGKHIHKLYKKLNSVTKELQEYKQQSSQVTAESRLKMNYPDFDSVVTPDHIAVLREQYPELAASINSNQDLYSKASSAYTLIKKLNIVPDSSYDNDRQRISQNMSKPRPLNSVNPQQGDSPLSRANAFAQGLTPELKNQLLKEMQDAKKRM